jgi:mono/diheme cytochrome c family protein
MKKTTIVLMSTAAVILAGVYACSNIKSSKEESPSPILSQTEMVKRGDYLVNSIGCDDCHSPKRMGPHGPEVIPELRFSGYPADRPLQKIDTNVVKQGWVMLAGDLTAAVGPWGVSFAANITPDETGIGNWTEHNFLTAIRHGKFKGLENNRSLLPPMPWFVYKNLTDEDLKSIFAYLKTMPAVKNVVPAPKPMSSLH